MSGRLRPLSSVLVDGDVVLYKYKGQEFQAYYKSGILVSADDESCTYNSATAFANSCSGKSVNGWKACRTLRDGIWTALNDLDATPITVSKTMPPPPSRKKAPIKAPVPATEPTTIIAGIIVAAEAPLAVTSVTRVTLVPVGDEKYIDETTGEQYVKTPNGGVSLCDV